jgi:hypothetical protein
MRLLGGTDAIPWAANDGGVTLSLPTDLPCEHAWVLEFGI